MNATPQQLGKYSLLKKIASGGMAEIHLAKLSGPQGFEKLVVLKLILPHFSENVSFVQMFLNEARIAAGLTHPNIAQIFDLGEVGGTYFLAMEYVQGENLRAITKACRKQGKELPLQHLSKIISQACEGLHYAHTRTDLSGKPMDIVHRDISPQNILVSFDGVVKLVDFGVAKAATQFPGDSTDVGTLKGKFSYMSPEQCRGESLDLRSDIFSMGIVLWELVTGARLFKLPSKAEVMQAVASSPIRPPREVNRRVPAELDAIILKALQRDVRSRFQSSLDMHLALEEFMRRAGLVSAPVHIGAFMRHLFPDKLNTLLRVATAQAQGKDLEALLFDDLTFDSMDLSSDVPAPPSDKPGDGGAAAPAGPPPLPMPLPPFPMPLPPLSGEVVPVASIEAHAPLSSAPTPEVPPPAAPTPALVPGPPSRKRSGVLLRAMVVLLLLGAAAAGLLLLRHYFLVRQPTSAPVAGGWGRARVQTTPAGARVELDGSPVKGRTPLTLDRLSSGREHILKVSLPGYDDWLTGFTVAPDQERTLTHSFQ